MKGLKLVFVGAALLMLSTSCKKDKVQVTVNDALCTDTISFINDIKPIFDVNCSTSGCHDSGSSAAGYTLNNHQNIALFADQSLGAMRHDGGFTPMPFGGTKLADSLIQKFECWIGQGKLNN